MHHGGDRMNSFGRQLRVQLFGESHGPAIGAVIDGLPPGVPVDMDAVQARLDQRRPGTGPLVSTRDEADIPEILSGVFEGRTTGAPLAFIIRNQDARSKDYEALVRKPRPGHSDLVANDWARGFHDPRGGGHYSGRLTAGLVAAAALLAPLLERAGVRVGAHLHQVHDVVGPVAAHDATTMQQRVADSPVHTAHKDLEARFVQIINEARQAKDSVGGVVEFHADGVPALLGDPMMDSVESVHSHILFAVPAVKGVSFGAGFDSVGMHGSQHNDPYRMQGGIPTPTTNHAGGILGGRTTGAPVWGHVAIKPTSSIFQTQDTVDLATGEDATLELKGRHDPCIAIRAVPVIRAAIELAITDLLLLGVQQGHVPSEVLDWSS